jgi:hypothetical protein
MSAVVIIPKYLSDYFDAKSRVEVEASDLKTALEVIARDFSLEDALLTSDGRLQSYIRVVIDETMLPSLKTADLARVPVGGKTVRIRAAIASG